MIIEINYEILRIRNEAEQIKNCFSMDDSKTLKDVKNKAYNIIRRCRKPCDVKKVRLINIVLTEL